MKKLKAFFTSKETINQKRRQPTDNLFAKIYHGNLQRNYKWVKELDRKFLEDEIQVVKNYLTKITHNICVCVIYSLN